MKIQHLKLLVLLIATIVLGISIKERGVSALVNLQPDPNAWGPTVPGPIYTEMKRADSATYSPSFFSWVSDDSNTSAQTVDVTYGAPSVGLKFNFSGVVGRSPNQNISTRTKVISASGNGPSGNPLGPATVTGLTTTPMQIDFTPNQNTPGKYDYEGDAFNFKPGGPDGFIREGEYVVNVVTKTISRFQNSAGDYIYRCVPSGGDVDTYDSWNSCPTTGWSFKINITITPTPPYNNQVTLNLCASGSPAGSTVQPGSSYKLCPKVDNVGGGGTLGIFTMGVENRYVASPTTSYASNAGQADLSPLANRAQIFGSYKDYKKNEKNCSPNQGNNRDCWLWLFQDLMPTKNVSSNFTFKVQNTAPVGGQVCFRPFVRRSTPSALSHIGNELCYSIQNAPNCPVGTDYAGQPIASQPDRNPPIGIDAGDCNNPPPPANYPYLQVLGDNVISGANFTANNSVCESDPDAATADIYTNGFHGTTTTDSLNGSSNTQYGAWASGNIGSIAKDINTFRANYGYVRNPQANQEDLRDGLFANEQWSNPSSEYGNFYDNNNTNPALPCVDITSEYSQAGAQDSSPNAAINFLTNNSSGIKLVPGGLTLPSLTVPNGTQKTLLVNGDLTITGDVNYPSNYNLSNIPNLKIIANNINIRSTTRKIDANLVAFPYLVGSTLENGIIDTCSDMIWQFPSGTPSAALPGEWPTNGRMTTTSCKQSSPSFVVNGSMTARRILFKRTNGSVGDKSKLADTSCYYANYTDNADIPKIIDATTAIQRYEKCAAELIKFSPELYISKLNINSSPALQVVPVNTLELPPVN